MVSVVIPCRNGEYTLGAQLDALSAQTYRGRYEVIVADNGSTDGSRSVAEARGVRVVDASGCRGTNRARNVGAAAASGDLLLNCDADDVVFPTWIEAMVEALASFDLVGGALELEQLNRHRAPRGKHRTQEPVFGLYPAATGANFGIHIGVLRALGGWDETFQGGPDEVELCWRAQIAGYTFGYAPRAVVHYRLRETTRELARQIYRNASFLPLLFRRFRPPRRHERAHKAARYALFVASAWPAALLSRRWRREFVRRLALCAGFARGLLRPVPPPRLGLRHLDPPQQPPVAE